MKRIIVIGCPGSGKSTFSRALNEKTGISLYHLDMMYWNPDKTTVEKTVFLERLEEVLGKDEWIIDGNYASTMEIRLRMCDTVIFLDYSVDVCLDGIRQRRGKVRTDMPWVEYGEDAEFMDFVKSFVKNQRPNILQLIEKYDGKNVITFKSREEAVEFLNELK